MTRCSASRRRRRGADKLAEGLVVLVFALLWELVARTSSSQFFPPPSEILRRFASMWFVGDPKVLFLSDPFRDNVIPSLERAGLGWLVAIVLGVSLGLLLGRAPRLWPYVEPVMEFLRSVPPAALLPFSLLVFGLADRGKIFIIVFGCVWPVLINTIEGARSVQPGQVETARLFQVGRVRTFFFVVLPASLPQIFAGIRVSLPIALIMMVLSELLGATNGIGYLILNAQRTFLVTDMWAAIVMLAVIGYVTTVAFMRLERRLLRWHGNFSDDG
jgi:ABC-type nitrate/sulfonate/bicarbonate transport system permease component